MSRQSNPCKRNPAAGDSLAESQTPETLETKAAEDILAIVARNTKGQDNANDNTETNKFGNSAGDATGLPLPEGGMSPMETLRRDELSQRKITETTRRLRSERVNARLLTKQPGGPAPPTLPNTQTRTLLNLPSPKETCVLKTENDVYCYNIVMETEIQRNSVQPNLSRNTTPKPKNNKVNGQQQQMTLDDEKDTEELDDLLADPPKVSIIPTRAELVQKMTRRAKAAANERIALQCMRSPRRVTRFQNKITLPTGTGIGIGTGNNATTAMGAAVLPTAQSEPEHMDTEMVNSNAKKQMATVEEFLKPTLMPIRMANRSRSTNRNMNTRRRRASPAVSPETSRDRQRDRSNIRGTRKSVTPKESVAGSIACRVAARHRRNDSAFKRPAPKTGATKTAKRRTRNASKTTGAAAAAGPNSSLCEPMAPKVHPTTAKAKKQARRAKTPATKGKTTRNTKAMATRTKRPVTGKAKAAAARARPTAERKVYNLRNRGKTDMVPPQQPTEQAQNANCFAIPAPQLTPNTKPKEVGVLNTRVLRSDTRKANAALKAPAPKQKKEKPKRTLRTKAATAKPISRRPGRPRRRPLPTFDIGTQTSMQFPAELQASPVSNTTKRSKMSVARANETDESKAKLKTQNKSIVKAKNRQSKDSVRLPRKCNAGPGKMEPPRTDTDDPLRSIYRPSTHFIFPRLANPTTDPMYKKFLTKYPPTKPRRLIVKFKSSTRNIDA